VAGDQRDVQPLGERDQRRVLVLERRRGVGERRRIAVEQLHLRGSEALDRLGRERFLRRRDRDRRARVIEPADVVEDAARFRFAEAPAEIREQSRVRELASASDREARELELADRDRVDRLPERRRLVGELDWQLRRVRRHLGDPAVHAGAERSEDPPVERRQLRVSALELFGRRSVAARLDVHREIRRSDQRELGKASARGASEDVHFEEPIFRLRIPGRVAGSDERFAADRVDIDVRHSVLVAHDVDRRGLFRHPCRADAEESGEREEKLTAAKRLHACPP
jgi:hypothetical protein